MKKMKIFLILFLFLTSLQALEVNEYLSDVYFANGINTDEDSAKKSRDVLSKKFKLFNPQAYHNVKDWKVSYNHTHGMGIDLYESFLQKIYEDKPGTSIAPFIWNMDEISDLVVWSFRGVVRKVAEKKSIVDIKAYAAKAAQRLAKKVVLVYNEKYGKKFTVEQIEAMFNNVFDYLIEQATDSYITMTEDEIIEQEQEDVATQETNYIRSIALGHGVIIVAHSQGNLFTNRVYQDLKLGNPINGFAWMRKYIAAIGVASPANNILGKKVPYLTFDNDMIQAVFDSLSPNVTNPKRYYFRNAAGENVETIYSVKAHSFLDSYMATDIIRNAILGFIDQKISDHIQEKSQWERVKDYGCACTNKYIEVKHKFLLDQSFLALYKAGLTDILNIFLYMPKQKIKDFTEGGNGKIYPVGNQYVRAARGGVKINEIDEGDACLALLDTDAIRLGTIKGPKDFPNEFDGVVDMHLSWNYRYDIDMNLSMKGPNVLYDIKDIMECPKEHAYVPYVWDLKPGYKYIFGVKGSKYSESKLEEEDIIKNPIRIMALLEIPTGNYFRHWEIKSFGQLNIGQFGEMDVKKIIKYKEIEGGGGGSPERTYNQCNNSEKKNTCGCVPCEYIVSGMKKRVENGPIAGASVSIIPLEQTDKNNPDVVETTHTTDSDDLFKSGLIELSDGAKRRIDADRYYLVSAQGGKDIDSDDDLYRDINPIENNGTIHAIIRGKDLLKTPFRVNILTEAIYQISGDVIGEHYNRERLEKKLDDATRKLLSQKLYIKDSNQTVRYVDILLWTPAVDKKALYKPFEIYVQPIIDKLYAGLPRYKESYRLIYEPYDSNLPQLAPLSLRIPQGLPKGTVIGQFVSSNGVLYDHIVIEGKYSDQFIVDKEGKLSIVKSESIRDGNVYHLRVTPIDSDGKKGTAVSCDIEVSDIVNLHDANASVPRLLSMQIEGIEENAPAGTVAARVSFEDNQSTIIAYRLGGQDSQKLNIDDNGDVMVAVGTDIDYESQPLLYVSVSAVNSAGNQSYPVALQIPVQNLPDTPLYDLEIFEHVLENTAVGSVITTIRQDRQAQGEIERFDILSPNIPFAIDAHGTIRVSSPLDYEQEHSYHFYAIAVTAFGPSNKIEINIIIDDQEPEEGIPAVQDPVEISLDENSAPGTIVGYLPIISSEDPIEKIAWSGVGKENFHIDENGTISIAENGIIDYEKRSDYNLRVKALNRRGWSRETRSLIHVRNLPDTPPMLQFFSAEVMENAPEGTSVGRLEVAAAGEGNITGYTLSGEGAKDFIVDHDGTIRVAQGADLDYEKRHAYTLQASAYSNVGKSNDARVSIRIKDLLDIPPRISPQQFSIEENATKGAAIGKIFVDPKYRKGITKFDINSDEAQIIHVDSKGNLSLDKAGVLDFEKTPSYQFQVTATNRYGTSDPVTITLDIIDTGTAPSIENQHIDVPFGRRLEGGLTIGILKIEDGDSPVTDVLLSGNGSTFFDIDNTGHIALSSNFELSKVRNLAPFYLKVMAKNIFGNSSLADLNISIEEQPEIEAGEDIAILANKSFSLNGEIDEKYRQYIKTIRWSSPDTDKINCEDANSTKCEMLQGLSPGSYEATFSVEYLDGLIQDDTLHITVSKDPLDNVLGLLQKPLNGLKAMKLSRDGGKIYAVGDFEGDSIFKIVDVSDPSNMHIVGSYSFSDMEEGGGDFDIDADESRVVIAGSNRVIALDISDLGNIILISDRDSNGYTNIKQVSWYKNDQLLAYEFDRRVKPYNKIRLMNVNDMTTLKTFASDSSIGEILAIPDQNRLIVSTEKAIRIYDINRSQIIFENNVTAENLTLDQNRTKLVFNGEKKLYDSNGNISGKLIFIGVLNLDELSSNSVIKQIENRSYDRKVYKIDQDHIYCFESGYDGSVMSTITLSDSNKPYIGQVFRIKSDMDMVIDTYDNQISYVYSYGGLKAISRQNQQSAGKFLYQFYSYEYFKPIELKDGYLYLLGYSDAPLSIFNVSNYDTPEKKGSLEIRKSCYPSCSGYENAPIMSVNYMKIIDDQGYIVTGGTPMQQYILDMSEKNQKMFLEVPSKYDNDDTFGNEFVMTEDQHYIYTPYTKDMAAHGVSVYNAKTGQQKNFILSNDRFGFFYNLLMSSDENKIFAISNGNLVFLNITDRKNILISSQSSSYIG